MDAAISGSGTPGNPFVIDEDLSEMAKGVPILVSDPVAREAIAILRGTDTINEIVLLDGNGTCVGRYKMDKPIAFHEGEHAYVNVEIRKG